jgi:hypothetical protein
MPPILSNNNPQPPKNNPVSAVRDIVDQIMRSSNPQAAFQQMLDSSPDCKNAMNLINQYGNGDPKQAFLNYASQTGKSGIAQQILQKLGLG